MASIFDDSDEEESNAPVAAGAEAVSAAPAVDARGSVKRKASDLAASDGEPASAAAAEGAEAGSDAESKAAVEDKESGADGEASGADSDDGRIRKKPKVTDLFEEMAEDEDGDDDDEDNSDVEDGDVAGLISDTEEGPETDAQRRKRLRQAREVMMAEEVDHDEVAAAAAAIEARHKAQKVRRVRAGDSAAQYIRPLPTPRDPKLFMCKVRDTKERVAQIQLLRKCHANPHFQILSIVDRGTKGHLYI